MSYTHYWTDNGKRKAELPIAAQHVIKQLVDEAYRREIIQRESGDPRPPIATATEVRFNGVRERAHQTFLFHTDGPNPCGRCRTARKPYDDVIMRVLLILACYRPGFEISSDGSFDHEWLEALDWFNCTVGRVYIKDQLCFEMPGDDRPQTISTLSF